MDKRGVYFRQIVMVFYLIMAAVVVLTLIQRTKYVVNDEEYADAYSKIIALTINSIFYSDYNSEVAFNIPSAFKVDITDNKVIVSISDTIKQYDYIPDSNFKIDFSRRENKLFLKKVKK